MARITSAPEDPTGPGSARSLGGSADDSALRASLTATLSSAGFVAAEEEADELLETSGHDAPALAALVARRLAGEPLAWLVGHAPFAGLEIPVTPGVYVPRWQSTELALRAAARLPESGVAADVCTGSGAIALALRQARPLARIVATETDPSAVDNARANGVEVYEGDLFAPLPEALKGHVDVVVAVVPYVPTPALALLPRDTLQFEDVAHYDGGPDGTALLERVASDARAYLRSEGRLLLELGGDQADLLAPLLDSLGYHSLETWSDEDGDVRGIESVFG